MPNVNRSTLLTAAPIAVAVVLILTTCWVQGQWSERWGEFPELQIYANSLKDVPDQVGEWKGTDNDKTDERILKVAGAAGELVRTYENPAGDQVRVSMIVARYRDVFNHTPDRCYPAAGFEMLNEPQNEVFDIGDRQAQFFTTQFQKSERTGSHVERGYWAWTADGNWVAPKEHKLEFAGERALFKRYVFASAPSADKSHRDPCEDFIRVFIPELERKLKPVIARANEVRGIDVAETPKEPETKPAS